LHARLGRYASKAGIGINVTMEQGCDIKLGAASSTMLTGAVALHMSSDATVLVIGDSTAGSAGFARVSASEGWR